MFLISPNKKTKESMARAKKNTQIDKPQKEISLFGYNKFCSKSTLFVSVSFFPFLRRTQEKGRSN